MIVCPQCGKENRDEARFCDSCGATLAREETSVREERKVVTVLFADLVGFTARAEAMDPEDVRAVLAPYHARLRTELESYGGTVEKFIGDAVMALFGAPASHEDDPERAVRAALAIRDWIVEEGELELRVAVTTGEALIHLSARPSEGEGMASGDVVNTAARLQAAAPVNGILVDETTYRATEPAIVYEEHAPVSAKGKAEPVAVWEAREARSRVGVDTVQAPRALLIGRERELEGLVASLARARAERSPQLVTIVGVPGIGKSRLVFELFNHVAADPDLIHWRQGRSLPYGEGVSFWALGEMVKAHVGILETDSPDEAGRKLERSVGDLLADGDANWVEGHLRPLMGLGTDQEAYGDHRVEAFAAWRRFFEAIAEDRPLVLVFEDLHWADEGLLDFVDHLVEWASGVPILAVCTARPELLTRRPGWGGGKPNAVTLSLSPLDDEQTARLLAALLERSVLPAETQSALLRRAGGNPLYAEEFVRMVADRDLLSAGEELPLPESVQGIVAARLDALPDQEKALLQDMAVIGKVFWLGAAAQIGGLERFAAEDLLHRLERKEFVRRERRSSVGAETEYAFQHLLVRDVAYAQIPRVSRAEKHQAVAEWIEALGRSYDHAEMLAHHYLAALEFTSAAGAETAVLSERARLALREAGDRAFALSAYPAARRFYEAAVELWPTADADRPQLLFEYGRVLMLTEVMSGVEVVVEARDALFAVGDIERTAEAEALLAEAFWLQGQRDRGFERIGAAESLIADAASSGSKAYVLSNLSRFLMLAGEDAEAIRIGKEALEMAEQLGLDELRAHALNNIGSSRVRSGDAGGLEDLEQSVAIAVAINSPEGTRSYGNLASMLADLGELERSSEMVAEGLKLAERFGLWEPMNWLTAETAWPLYFRGHWREAFQQLDELIADFEESGFWMETSCRGLRGRMRLARGDMKGAQADAERAIERARIGKDPQVVWPALAFGARAFAATDERRAEDLAGELLSEQVSGFTGQIDWALNLAVVASLIGREGEFLEAAARTTLVTPWLTAATAYVSRDFGRAADVYAGIGALPEEAYARLRGAEAFVRDGHRAEADAELARALQFWRSVGATAYVREGEALLAESA
jgi:class 3 adenylate cyclase/tetratricopeptide (TPR) repeat protein